jgi:5-methylcytosine-specific restriction protein A
MNYYLLTWNPNRYPWRDLEDWIDTIHDEGSIERTWSVGNRKHISAGDRIFLMRQGEEPRGIIGFGRVLRDGAFEAGHWPDLKYPSRDDDARYAHIAFEELVDPKNTEPFVTRDDLQSSYPDVHWDTQQSGIEVRENVGKDLVAMIEAKAKITSERKSASRLAPEN